MFQAWQINVWSRQYIHHVLNPFTEVSVLMSPPTEHDRAAFWLASSALKSGNPVLAKMLIASKAASGDRFAMRVMGDVHFTQGNFTDALAIWQQAGDVLSLLEVASQAQQAGRLDEALMAYNAAWDLDIESVTLPLASFLFNNKKDYNGAENVLRKSLVSLPNSSYWFKWYSRLGDVLRAQKRWSEAVSIYQSVIAHRPDDWAAYVGLGWTKYERGDGWQAAMGEFQKAIDFPESQGNGHLAIAQMLSSEKRFEEADTWYKQALTLNPQARWWYVIRGNTAREAGNLTLALTVYRETLKRFPDFAQAYYEIARAYQLDNQTLQAKTSIEQALVLMTLPNVYYYMRAGNIYEWAGNEEQALYAYQQALLIDPQNVAILKSVDRLQK